MKYRYLEVMKYINKGKYTKVNIYPETITYGENGAYKVTFKWQERMDVRTSSIMGFHTEESKRLESIEVKNSFFGSGSGENVFRKYEFDYKENSEATLYKSLLSAIYEKNWNNEIVNEHKLKYDIPLLVNNSYINMFEGYEKIDALFLEDKSFSSEENAESGFQKTITSGSGNTYTQSLSDFVDINGDGLKDRVAAHEVHINTGRGFVNAGRINNLDYYNKLVTLSSGNDSFVEGILSDFNGDSLPDIIEGHEHNIVVRLNRGFYFSDTITKANNSQFEDYLIVNYGPGNSSYALGMNSFFDINGDGLPERVFKTNENMNDEICFELNNNSFGHFGLPECIADAYEFLSMELFAGHYRASLSISDLLDINGDGLPDRVDSWKEGDSLKEGASFNVELNKMNGFTNYEWVMPSWNALSEYSSFKDYHYPHYNIKRGKNANFSLAKMIDINGDGLPDRVAKNWEGDLMYIQLNLGNRFINLTPVKIVTDATGTDDDSFFAALGFTYTHGGGISVKGDFTDFDGDSVPDLIYAANFKEGSDHVVYFVKNKLAHTNILKSIENAKTGQLIDLTYGKRLHDTIKNYDSYNAETDPRTDKKDKYNYRKQYVLQNVTISSPASGSSPISTDIEYFNGVYDRVEREFRGFEKVVSSTSPTLQHYFSKVYSVEEKTYDMSLDGRDIYNINDHYDQYKKGRELSVVNKLKYFEFPGLKTVMIDKKEFDYVKDEVFSSLSKSKVKFVYPKYVTDTVYNDKGSVVGKLKEKKTHILDKTSGLPISNIEENFEYNASGQEIHIDNKTKTTTTYNAGSGENFFLLPKAVEVQNYLNKIISMKTTAYSYGRVVREITENIDNQSQNIYINYYPYKEAQNVTVSGSSGVTTKVSTKYLNAISNNSDNAYYSETVTILPDGGVKKVYTDHFGRLKMEIDRYGDETVYNYDDTGRVKEVWESANGTLEATKVFLYGTSGEYFRATAAYKNKLGSDDWIGMQFYKDKLGRDVQTKRAAKVNGRLVYVVSGAFLRDEYGRVIKQGIPTTISPGTVGFGSFVDNKSESFAHSAIYSFDKFGRFAKSTSPNGYEVSKEYDTVNGKIPGTLCYDGIERIVFMEVVKDSLGKENITCRDINGDVTLTKSLISTGEYADTKFEYKVNGYGKVIEPEPGLVGEKQFDSLGRLKCYEPNCDQLFCRINPV